MKNTLICAWLAILVIGVATTYSAPADDAPAVKMKLVPDNAMATITHSYMPRPLALKADEPAGLKKKPAMDAPLFGEIKFGGKSYIVALDEPKGQDAKLYVDANGNGDLTDDPAAKWTKDPKNNIYMGSFQLPLPGEGDKPTMVTLRCYRFDPNDPNRASLKTTMLYYADYVYAGEITIGGVAYRSVLVNDLSDGDFRGAQSANGQSGVRLMIDLNKDGNFDFKAETFDVRKPFNIKGTTWELADLTAAGDFKIQKSSKEVAEIPLPPDLSRGHDVIAFTATMMDGKKVNFPTDYKGKLVMLDFWATWCGPCMGEVPGLVKTYNAYHEKGFEILGISLDQPNAADQVKKVTGEKGMTWPQVYDGKFWDARIAQMYGIRSIPRAFLVDGDTGRIVAEGNDLRGEKLEPTLKKALEEKAKGSVN